LEENFLVPASPFQITARMALELDWAETLVAWYFFDLLTLVLPNGQ